MSTSAKKMGNLFQIGTQVDLPIRKIGDIAWRNMKHRFGRSIVTTSGVILATAFLMAMLLKNSVVGAMLQATSSLKNVVVDVPLTKSQAKDILTVLKDQLPGFQTQLKDQQEVLAENQKTEQTWQQDLAGLAKDLTAFEAAPGKAAAGKEKEWRATSDKIKQRQVDLLNTHSAIKDIEEKVVMASSQVRRTEFLLNNVKEGTVFSAVAGNEAERAEQIALVQFLQRLGKQLENELQSRSIQEAPAGGTHRPAGAASATANVSTTAPAVVPAPPPSSGAPKDLWLTGLALVVAGVGITNAMLMSVTERFREIGTMKCLGALDSFIMKLFLIESAVQGGMGTIAGIVIGVILMYGYLLFNFTFNLVSTYWPWGAFFQDLGVAFAAGVVISVIGAAFPSLYASRMDPIAAMRQEI